jgi:hypothetical protein
MKMLRNVKTGATFLFHPLLAKNKDMEPYEQDQEDEIIEIGGSKSSGGIIIDKATKAELIDFAAVNYGVEIDKGQGVADIRAQVRKLVEDDSQ